MILERLNLENPIKWLETHADFLSVQATLYSGKATTWWQRMQVHIQYYERVENGK